LFKKLSGLVGLLGSSHGQIAQEKPNGPASRIRNRGKARTHAIRSLAQRLKGRINRRRDRG
jgi:hypothetical protein